MNIDPDQVEQLLEHLPPAPARVVRTAQELPFVRDEIDAILGRAGTDPDFRHALGADPHATLHAHGYDLSPDVVAHILRRVPGAE